MTRGERILLAMKRAGYNRTKLGEAVGVSQQAISYIIEREDGSTQTLEKIAEKLSVPFEWLTVGDNPPAWAIPQGGRLSLREQRFGYSAGHVASGRIPIDGVVSAGPGHVSEWRGAGGALTIPPHWSAVRVMGDSAYPAIYSGQLALVDESRAIDITRLDEESGWDLDDDVVLVRMTNDRALLKRFCFHPPNDFVLASVNGGRRSPLIRRDDILHIVPVVAVIWNDPEEDREARRKAKRAAREQEHCP